jgi:hypothetical protein|tara:strand:- start:3161 stop:3349 length:189 start_codon:yes stop_codon:yes gene_type:complete
MTNSINKGSRVNVKKDLVLFNGAVYSTDILKVQEVKNDKALIQHPNGRLHWVEISNLTPIQS